MDLKELTFMFDGAWDWLPRLLQLIRAKWEHLRMLPFNLCYYFGNLCCMYVYVYV